MMHWIFLLAVLLASSSAHAFHEVSSFSRTANSGGGNGQYFTGSKRFKGYNCGICHVAAEQRISIGFESELSSGVYTPGLIYPITIKLRGEHRGLQSAFNPNTFAADFTDGEGNPVGLVAGGGQAVLLEDERTVAVAEGFGEGETEWNFSWYSPAEGTPVTLHIAMLDGDGANDPVNRFIDPLNDDVATFQLALCPVDEVCEAPLLPPEEIAPMGCSASEPKSSTLALALLLMLLSRQRKRRLV